MIILNLETYGDFEMASTEALLAAPTMMTVAEVERISAQVRTTYGNTDDPQGAIKLLKSYGFTTVKYVSAAIGGNM